MGARPSTSPISQQSASHTTIVIKQEHPTSPSAYTSISTYCVIPQWRTSAPLFQWGRKAMSETAVNKLLRAALHAAGVPHAHTFSSHSLSVGGATAAMAVGVDPESIKVLGRWDSMAYKMYTRLSQQAARRVGVAVASAAVDF